MDYPELYDSENPYTVLGYYCRNHNISEDLANAMAVTANADSSSDEESDDTDDSDDVVFNTDDWKDMDTAGHQAKVRAFLKEISFVGKDAREMQPVLKSKSLLLQIRRTPPDIRVAGEVAPYVGIGYNAGAFIGELNRLAEENPRQVCTVLGRVLETYIPSDDYGGKLIKLLRTLSSQGMRVEVVSYTELLRHLPGMAELYRELTK
jgi:hypothetical protein